MGESLNDLKTNSLESSTNPFDYNSLLDRYTSLSKEIRHTRFSRRTGDNGNLDDLKIQLIDSQRHDIHLELITTGSKSGKSPNQVGIDILTNEGNLREIGIDAPIIQLPILGTSFNVDRNNQTIKSDSYNSLHLCNQSLRTYCGREIVAIRQNYNIVFKSRSQGTMGDYEEDYSGDKGEIDKWTQKPFYAIVYSVSKSSNGIISNPDYPFFYKTRLKRLINLAKDCNLNIFRAHDNTGHVDYGPVTIEGVEVSGEDLKKIGDIMRKNPSKYWLTQEELTDPYKQEYLKTEISESELADSYINKAINRQNPENNTWRDWYNFLRIYDVLNKTYPDLKKYFNEYYEYTYRKHDFKNLISGTIQKIPYQHFNIGVEMKRILEENF